MIPEKNQGLERQRQAGHERQFVTCAILGF